MSPPAAGDRLFARIGLLSPRSRNRDQKESPANAGLLCDCAVTKLDPRLRGDDDFVSDRDPRFAGPLSDEIVTCPYHPCRRHRPSAFPPWALLQSSLRWLTSGSQPTRRSAARSARLWWDRRRPSR